MPDKARRWTREMVLALPDDGNRYELFDGELLVTPAPALGGQDISQPDLFVVPHLPPDRDDWSAFPNPILVSEILSPSTARFDRITKRRQFQRAGIPEYWVVDLDARAVERWRPGDERPEILDERLTWLPEGAAEPLELDLPEYFREVWGTP